MPSNVSSILTWFMDYLLLLWPVICSRLVHQARSPAIALFIAVVVCCCCNSESFRESMRLKNFQDGLLFLKARSLALRNFVMSGVVVGDLSIATS